MHKRITILSVLGVLVGVAFLAWFLVRKPDAPQRLRVGAVLALTGSGANYGKSLQRGLELAKEQINSTGGVGGRQLEVLYEDSQGDAKTGLAAFTKLTSVDRTPVVFGSISSVVLAIQPLANEKGVLLINSSAISPKICSGATGFSFSFMVSGKSEAIFIAETLGANPKPLPTAVIYSNNASGKDTFEVFRDAFAAKGGKLVGQEAYELGTSDFSTQITKLRSTGATQVVIIAFSSAEWAGILRSAARLDYRPRWVSYSGFETHETLQLAGDAANGVVYSFPKYDPASTGPAAAFYERYKRVSGTWPDIYTLTSYDALVTLAKVVGKGSLDAAAIRDSLARASGTEGIFGALRYADRQCVGRELMWKEVRDGRYVAADQRLGSEPR